MAINMMCLRDDCRYYWEDNCTRNINEKSTVINEFGGCATYEKGKSDWYEDKD